MAEAILGMRGTGSWGLSSNERPTNFREKILREYPNGPAVFMGLLGMLKSEDVDDVKFTIFEQTFPDQIHALVATGDVTDDGDTASTPTTSTGTTDQYIVLGTTEYTNPENYFKVGHIIKNETTGEVMLVVGKGSTLANSLKVIRNIGASATYGDNSGSVGTGVAPSNSQVITIIGNANIEGDNYPTAIAYQPSERWNFIETFRTALELTDDAAQTYFRTGKVLDNLKYDAAMQHSMEMEKAFWFGKRELLQSGTGSDTVPYPITPTISGRTSTQDQRFMGGFNFFVDSNYTTDFSSGLSRAAFLEFLRPIYTIPGMSMNKIAFCGSQALGVMTQYAEDLGQIFLEPSDKTYGLQIRTLVHAWGELKMVNHPLFSEHPSWAKRMHIVDTKNVMYRFLRGRDTRFLKDRQGNGEDKTVHEFMTKASLELRHPRTHGIATGIDAFVG